jgi:AcrR family transcriptional regulator
MVRNEDKIQARKKQIVDALKVRLNSDVYSRITVQDIAQQSGFSKGGVLHYFPSKEDIYFALIEDIFSEIDRAHQQVIQMGLKSHSTTSLSALVGVENFILDKTNVRVIINLILYAFEDEKVLSLIRGHISRIRAFYSDIRRGRQGAAVTAMAGELNDDQVSRIVQTIMIFVGVLEFIDPVETDHIEMTRFVTSLLRS